MAELRNPWVRRAGECGQGGEYGQACEAFVKAPNASGSPVDRRWWLVRTALRAVYSLFRSVDRVAPRFTDLLGLSIAKAHGFEQRIRFARQGVVTMDVGKTRFRLCLVSGVQMAHDYLALAAKGEVYEPVATACLTRVLQSLPDPTFMDIGAFIGYFTCYAAALLGDQRPVWAVESNPVFCEAIRQAIALNGFTRVGVLQAALSDRTEAVTVGGFTVLTSSERAPGQRVEQAVTLDDLCAREGIAPTIVKIDVHGGEGKVLRGMSRLLRESIQIVLLELHTLSVYKPHSPDITRAELLDWLEQHGFSMFHVSGHRWEHRSGMATYLEQGRFAYVPLTAATRQLLMFDRQFDILIVASKIPDIAGLLGPSVDLAAAVG